MTHVFLLVHPRADYAGFCCAASVLLRTRFLVWAVSNLGEVVHGPNRSATLPPPLKTQPSIEKPTVSKSN